MERRLILMRHAKSSWKSDAPDDHARPLNGRGRRDAPRVARCLVARGWLPDAVFSSDAERTRETWARMAPELPHAPPPTFTRSLYLAGLPAIRQLARAWNPELRTLLLLGHNPGWEQALGALTGTPGHMTTGNAALLIGRGDTWADALAGPWTLVELIRPRDLPDD